MARGLLLVLAAAAAVTCALSVDANEEAQLEFTADRPHGLNFFRHTVESRLPPGRRVLGGTAAQLSEYPAACALLDARGRPACSCSVLRERWALTAAHCLTAAGAAHVNYNTPHAGVGRGDLAVVQYHYRHPKYKVEWSDSGHGTEVSALQHDVGLVRTRSAMRLRHPRPRDPAEFTRYEPAAMGDVVVRAYGFGEPTAPNAPAFRSDGNLVGHQLMSMELRMTSCNRTGWYHVACGLAVEPGGCAGFPGGPVVYRGAQLAVASLGPLGCGGALAGAASVLTALYNYADVIDSTVREKDDDAIEWQAAHADFDLGAVASPPPPYAELELDAFPPPYAELELDALPPPRPSPPAQPVALRVGAASLAPAVPAPGTLARVLVGMHLCGWLN